MKAEICQFYLFHNKFVAKAEENRPCPWNRRRVSQEALRAGKSREQMN